MGSFYIFQQNNSGGYLEEDEKRGIGEYVFIESESAKEANSKAENIGLYFDGVENGIDCECCGDRWNSVYEYDKIESDELNNYIQEYCLDDVIDGKFFVHYSGGKFVGYTKQGYKN